MNIQALISHVINTATAQLVDMAQASGLFARSVASELDVGDIAAELDLGDIAYELDYSQIAEEVNLSDLENEIDYAQLATFLETPAQAPAPVSDGALSQLSQQVLAAAVERLLNMANAHVENGS
tara:strand:+ start:108 stop:479 length:372 start_codon:yes stop_codon:yes gene_type:complete